ncbi:MAG: mannitol-1-phosphate 5-dehydrogenase [Oscillospiraceae bacterium]|nr:mannitol-1-phosphate 5-dehydrogenase [Oscillospiraceae bacterium]
MSKKAVMYGAGNIGRGFIGKAFSESGYEVCFIDVQREIVEKLNQDRCYPVKIVTNEAQTDEMVKNVRAISGLDVEAVADAIAEADIMATAVGVNVLPKIVKALSSGLKKRFDGSGRPLNIIICENLIDADKYLRKLLEDEMRETEKATLDSKLGLVEASIGRMVPVMTSGMRGGNLLNVWVEPYDELPVDKDAFVGQIPEIRGLLPFSPFGFYIKRKLFVHNLGHSMCAYLGWQKGYSHIYECVADQDILTVVKKAMQETAAAIYHEYGMQEEQLSLHIDDLLFRFGNTALGDTVARVGRDPLRKLGINDRLIGAALYCGEQGVDAEHLITGIVAGLSYDNVNDEFAVKMQSQLSANGIEGFLVSSVGLSEASPLFQRIVSLYARKGA